MRNNTWTWVSGSNEIDHRGFYGAIGEASINYVPSGRRNGVGWLDISTNELWLFGGHGIEGVSGLAGT